MPSMKPHPKCWVGTRGESKGSVLREEAVSKVKSLMEDYTEGAPSGKAAGNPAPQEKQKEVQP